MQSFHNLGRVGPNGLRKQVREENHHISQRHPAKIFFFFLGITSKIMNFFLALSDSENSLCVFSK